MRKTDRWASGCSTSAPIAERPGRAVFARMVDEILDFDAHLVIGEEPARRRLGALGDTDDPLVLVRAAEETAARPGTRAGGDSTGTGERSARAPTVRPAPGYPACRPADASVGAPGNRLRSRSSGRMPRSTPYRSGTRADPRRTGRRAHARFSGESVHPRHAAGAASQMQRNSTKGLDDLAREACERHGRPAVANRVDRWNQILGEMGRAFATAERRRPFSEVRRPEVTAAGLNAVAAHPLYARFWRLGWEALRRGVYRIGSQRIGCRSVRRGRSTSGGASSRCRGSSESGSPTTSGRIRARPTPIVDDASAGAAMEAASRSICSVPSARPEETKRPRAGRFHASSDPIWCLLHSLPTARRDSSSSTQSTAPAESGILNGMVESVHPYADALRWGPHRPERTLLLVPNATETEWLTRTDYVDRHRVGVVPLRPRPRNAGLVSRTVDRSRETGSQETPSSFRKRVSEIRVRRTSHEDRRVEIAAAKKVEKSCRGDLTGFCACELARHRTFQPLPASEKLTGPVGCTAPRSARAVRRFIAGPGRRKDVYLKTGSIFTA